MNRNRRKTWAISLIFLCWGLMVSGPSQVFGEDEIPAIMVNVDCSTVRSIGLSLVADHFYADETDLALSMIMYIEGHCGSDEKLRRIQLLGAIWDGSFSEDMYYEEIIGDLVARADTTNFDTGYAHFDSFTTDFADQLLPHAERQSLEEFFCLFHSGRVDEAYALLQHGALDGTDLEAYYSQELQFLEKETLRGFGGIYGSYWVPSGNLSRLGDHAMAGLTLGWLYEEYFARMNFGFRFARSRYPYYVDHNDESGWSDRTIGVKMTLEFGSYYYRKGSREFGAFIGGGLDVLHPFNEIDEYSFMGVLVLVGAEYKLWLDEGHIWNVSLGVQKEWYGSWDGNGTDLSGDAWDLRFGIGMTPGNKTSRARRAKLGY